MLTYQVYMSLSVQAVPAAQHSQLAYLSGPSFAAEVAEGKPTGLTIAARVCATSAPVELMQAC